MTMLILAVYDSSDKRPRTPPPPPIKHITAEGGGDTSLVKASFVGAEVAGGGYEERKPTFQFCFHVVMVVGRVEWFWERKNEHSAKCAKLF